MASLRPDILAASDSRHARRAVIIASITQLVVVLDGAVLLIALPLLAQDLGVGVASLPWVANAYALTMAGTLLLGGRIADLFGAVACLRLGLALFAVASLGAGLAPTFEILILFRLFQGLAAALLSPASLALITNSTSVGVDRERAIATWAVTATIGGTLGALLGGAVTQLIDWRWTLLINVFLAPALILMTKGITLGRAVEGGRPKRRHYDFPGAALLLVFVGFIMLSVTLSVDGRIRGWAVVVAVAALAAFVAVERRSAYPILPLSVMRSPRVTLTNGAAFLLMAGLAASGFYTSLYAQLVSGLSPIVTALALLPSAVASAVVAKLVPRLICRFGERALRASAPLLAAFASLLLAVAAFFQLPFAALIPLLILQSIGASIAVVTLTSASTRSLPARSAGLAGGLITTAGQVGSSIGLAVLVGLAALVAGSGSDSHETGSIAVQMAVALAAGAVSTVTAGLLAQQIPPGNDTEPRMVALP
ncbi:MFS transporter [Arthrobacter sp. PAMC 25486]|uniref:MFS transporter n=1 Tax=Arthrobacter sp. PAMC 25486 TaxID=1494608 RepID=UPI0012FE84B0|nr:MFS transporter [Arthrobacter sp. PAMC 25486]